MLVFLVCSFLSHPKSALKEINAFLLTFKSCPADCFWVRPCSPPSSSGTGQEQIPRAVIEEMCIILQHHSGHRSTLSNCPHVCNVVPFYLKRNVQCLIFLNVIFSVLVQNYVIRNRERWCFLNTFFIKWNSYMMGKRGVGLIQYTKFSLCKIMVRDLCKYSSF